MIDVSKSEIFENFPILKTALQFLIKLIKLNIDIFNQVWKQKKIIS